MLSLRWAARANAEGGHGHYLSCGVVPPVRPLKPQPKILFPPASPMLVALIWFRGFVPWRSPRSRFGLAVRPESPVILPAPLWRYAAVVEKGVRLRSQIQTMINYIARQVSLC